LPALIIINEIQEIMKTTISLLIGFLLLHSVINAGNEGVGSNNSPSDKPSVEVICTPDLSVLTSGWVSEYNRLHPEAIISLLNKTENNTGKYLGFSTEPMRNESNPEESWKMVVGRSIIVPLMNSDNPFLKEINQKGISPEVFARIIQNSENQHWGSVVENGQKTPLHLFIVNDASVKAGITKFIHGTILPERGIIYGNSNEILQAVQNDPYAIGFFNIAGIIDKNNILPENISFLPVDKNGNGSLDNVEDIYADLNHFTRGVWIGKYPNALYSNIYAVSNSQPSDEAELSFLNWVITDGQHLMNSNGYCELVDTEVQSQLDRINLVSVIAPAAETGYSTGGIILIIIAAFIVLGLVFSVILRHSYNKKNIVSLPTVLQLKGFDLNAVKLPKGLFFDKTHTWAFMESDGNVKIGIDDFIQHIIGPITHIEMRKPGEKIKKGDLLLTIFQSGKRLNMYAPVSGIIKSQNDLLNKMSSSLNDAPYAEGWVYRIEPAHWFREIQLMDMAERYERFLNTEFTRVKDFLASMLKADSPEYAHVVLQDGGLLTEGVLSGFGPEVWEDFQTTFLDSYK
jgi:glycine cleavage system H lipoate-binding protein/ABC-type phosphate transport system substrate-binding protein